METRPTRTGGQVFVPFPPMIFCSGSIARVLAGSQSLYLARVDQFVGTTPRNHVNTIIRKCHPGRRWPNFSACRVPAAEKVTNTHHWENFQGYLIFLHVVSGIRVASENCSHLSDHAGTRMFQISAEHFTSHYRDPQFLATCKDSFFMSIRGRSIIWKSLCPCSRKVSLLSLTDMENWKLFTGILARQESGNYRAAVEWHASGLAAGRGGRNESQPKTTEGRGNVIVFQSLQD